MKNNHSHIKMGWTIFFAFVIITLLGACGTEKNSQVSEENYPNAFLLVDSEWVSENLNDEKLIILDARSKGYEEGHIPNAIPFGTAHVTDAENEIGGFLLNEADFQVAAREVGINQDSTILIYDDGNALSATRVFYALELYGLQDQVKILNGGYGAWLVSGQDVSFNDAPEVTLGNFTAVTNQNLITTREEITASIDQDNIVFLDARSDGEYAGTDLRGNKRGGHLPGAVHQEWTESIAKNDDGIDTFLSYGELQKKFGAIGAVEGKTVVPYCQTNVRGAHTYFTLRLMGYSDIRPYEGSWSEWGNADDTIIEG